MPLRDKYPIDRWVLSKENVDTGDIVAFWDAETDQEIQCRVTIPTKQMREHREYGNCLPVVLRINGEEKRGLLNFYNNIVYKITGREIVGRECSCGAKHTSNPNWHMHYCDFGR